MPRSTSKYSFEYSVFEGCSKLAHKIWGNSTRGFGFTALIDANGKIVLFKSNNLDGDQKSEYSGFGKLFYDPFDAPEYTFIEWKNVTRKMMEKALDIDLKNNLGWPESMNDFPSSHQVMF